jgi:glyoxylase-like metal-dependent hydrolase (beta-lactamase superfamily II)
MKKILSVLMTAMPLAGGAQEAATADLFTYKIGKYEVVLLPETQGEGNASILLDATPEILKETMPNGTYPNAVNAFLVKTPEGNILFDTGFGRNLTKNLAAAGVKPEEISTLVITHMHGDHIGGMLTKDGKRAFPNAKLLMSAPEKAFWVDTRKQDNAVKAFDAYRNNASLFDPIPLVEKQIDGIYICAAYGHTPGHVIYLLRSQGEQLLIWGDIAHAMAVQMPYPNVSVTYDSDPKQAAKSREEVLSFVSRNHIPVAGMHIPYPGMGMIETLDKGYVFVPFK